MVSASGITKANQQSRPTYADIQTFHFVLACREAFNAKATLDGGLELQSVHRAADGTCKMLFKLKVNRPTGQPFTHRPFHTPCLG